MNGTRLIVKKLHPNLIEAEISVGRYQGDLVLIPRIPLNASDDLLPFTF